MIIFITILFIGIISYIAIKNKMDVLHMFLPLIKGKYEVDEDGNLSKTTSMLSNLWFGITFQVLIFLLIIATMLHQGNWSLDKALLIFFPTYLTIEWIVYLGFFLLYNTVTTLRKSKELLILFLTTVLAIIYASTVKTNDTKALFPLLFIVILNIIQTVGIMFKLCVRNNDFLQRQFEKITPVTQIFVVLFIIAVHICNFVILIYFYCNGSAEIFLQRNDAPVKELEDIIYYVIVTYSTVGYGDITPGCSEAQLFASIISLTSMLMTGVIIGKIIGATISSFVSHHGETTLNESDAQKLINDIKNIVNSGGNINFMPANGRRIEGNRYSLEMIKNILLSLQLSDYKNSYLDIISKKNDMLHIFLPSYDGRKYYVKLSIKKNHIFCLSCHEAGKAK